MTILSTVQPLAAAIEKLGAKTPIASILRSAEWADVPLALRERAQFSSAVESARVLQTIQDKLMAALSLQKEDLANGKQAYVDRSSFIGDLRKIVQDEGLGTGEGGLTDLSSRARLGLIFDMQTQQAQEYGRWKSDMDPDVLDAYPAQELIRIEDRMVPRDWISRWEEAGGVMVDGDRMVALKTDPIWTAISRFGTPWPPFDFGSGMGLEDVSRAEAEDLGLMEAGEKVEPTEESFNEDLFASVQDLGEPMLEALKTIFGDQIKIADGQIAWEGQS